MCSSGAFAKPARGDYSSQVSNDEDDKGLVAIRTLAMPADTNAHGTIFGGMILSLIDQAGAVAAQSSGAGKVVTVAMREVVFHAPVHVGDVITCHAKVVRRGKSSMTICVRVEAEAPSALARKTEPRLVTVAEVVYVQIDERGRPLPL